MLLHADGFDHYATADLTKKWTAIQGISTSTILPVSGRRGGGAFSTATASGWATKTLPSSPSTVIAGFAFRPANNGAANHRFFSLLENGAYHIYLNFNAANKIDVTRNSTLLATGSAVLSIGAFYYIEVKATIHDTTGAVTVRVNGLNDIVLTNVDTRNAGAGVINQVGIGDPGTFGPTGGAMWDDFYLCDTSGTTNNDFLGDTRVDTLYPNADGAFSAWTPSAANGAHRYWRLYVDAVLGGTVIALTELGLSLTSGGATVTTGGTASANSVSSGLAANAFDGNSGTWWGTASSQVPGWIAYDFGAGVTKNIKGFSLTSQNSASYAQTAPTQFQLQFSDDGVVWTTLVVASAPTWTQNETKVFSADLTGAAHSGMVNDPIPNLTNYNYALTIGLRDSYAFQDLPSLVSSTVYGVQVNAAMLKDDAGNKQVALFTRASGGENTDGATVALGTSQTYVSQIFEKNLNGTADWTQATVNSAEFGVKVVV